MARSTAGKKSPTKTPKADTSKRVYMRQSDVPTLALDDALRLPQAIFEHYAGKATKPFDVARALQVDPKGSQLRVISGAAIAFGLIDGGAQASVISPTELARRIIRPRAENEDLAARREAVLMPRIYGEFLRSYDGNQIPRQDIALNVLENLGVPREKAGEVFDRIVESASAVGYIVELKGKNYVRLDGAAAAAPNPEARSGENIVPFSPPKPAVDAESDDQPPESLAPQPAQAPAAPKGSALNMAFVDDQRRRRVFITHGKNRELVEPIKKLLEYGELEAVVSVERQSVSKPVPEKILGDMRKCGAAIIHVDVDETIVDKNDVEHVVLNPNVLIEIGAAMVSYGKRFILLVRDGVKLPSNLQGLYEVRYSGDTLDAAATIKLLEAMKDIKNYELPDEQDSE